MACLSHIRPPPCYLPHAHRLLGVDHFFLYDTHVPMSAPAPSTPAPLAPRAARGSTNSTSSLGATKGGGGGTGPAPSGLRDMLYDYVALGTSQPLLYSPYLAPI